jgi:hypothetical protein
MNPRRLFLYLLIGSIGLSALIAIGVLLFGNFGSVEVRVLFTTLTVTVTSIFGLACGAYLETGRGRYLPITGIALSIVAALMCFLIIWDVLDDNEVFIKSFLTATMIAAACSHLSLLSLARLDKKFSWTRIAAVACVVLLCAILLYILWFEPEGDSDLIYRILGVLGILVASITVVTPILHKLSSKDGESEKIDTEIEQLKAQIAELEKRRSEIPKTD